MRRPTTTVPFRRLVLFTLLVLSLAVPAFAQDAIDLSQAVIHASPADVASWPVTSQITHLEMRPGHDAGLSLDFAGRQTWPNYTPPGWDGPIQYTVWAGVFVGGQWHIAGFIQMWRERPSTGAPILQQFASDWAYSDRWGPLRGYQPHAGEEMIFFATPGNARDTGGVTSLRERTNVVKIALPPGDDAAFAFAGPPSPNPQPSPNPDPVPDPLPPAPSGTVTLNAEQYDAIMARFDRLEQELDQARQDLKAAGTDLLKRLPALLRSALLGR